MRKFKSFLKRCLVTTLALSMAIGTGTMTSAGETKESEKAKKDLVIYFANWDVYSNPENGQVKNIPWEKVTYVNHAFWEIQKTADDSYVIKSTDEEADLTSEKAHFTQYAEYSERYPDVNIMISIGGWSRCGFFSEMAQTREGRKSFIDSCIETMETYPWIDGIDVDWEYPGVSRPADGNDQGCPVVGDDWTNYTLLLKEMREAFDGQYGKGRKKLTTCSSVNIETINKQNIAEFSQYVDLINIMSYDMTGTYDPKTGHHSALYKSGEAKHSTDAGVEYFLEKGVPASKINIGSPLYCHGWGSVVPDETGNVIGVSGSAEGYTGQKVWNLVKAIELLAVEDGQLGWHKGYDETAEAAYLYNDNPNSKYYQNYLTYENERSLKAKLDYIYEKNLAGMIVWESGGDSIVDEYPMITQMGIALGIYDGEQTVYGQAGQIPEIDDTVNASGYPDPIREVVAGDGSKIYKAGTYIYYKEAVWKSINDNSSDWPANLPDGEWGASCWTKEFDVIKHVSSEEMGWAWIADEGDYVFYDPDKDGVGAIYYAKAQTSNTPNDAPDGIWGTNWEYVTGLCVGDAAEEKLLPDNMVEVVPGDGSIIYKSGTKIYYKGAIWKSINDNSSDWPANLPDGEWGASCWTKEFDIIKHVSSEEMGWAWIADEGDYVFYDPDKDGVGAIYYAKAQTSNTPNDAPDGIWGTNWIFVTNLTVVIPNNEEETTTENTNNEEEQTTNQITTGGTNKEETTSSTVNKTSSTSVSKVKILSSKRYGKNKKIKLKVKKISGIAGYKVRYSTTKDFKKGRVKTIRIKTKKTKLILNVRRKTKKYYVKIKAFKIVNGKRRYSKKWSKVKVVKVK